MDSVRHTTALTYVHFHADTFVTAAESENGFLFCHECKDFVYDPTFEDIRCGNPRKRKRIEPQLDGEMKRLIANNSAPAPCAATGLRGFYNMGQTCFMSVILQAIVHNPLIRASYLSEGHRKEECEREACTSCALDDIFTDFFSQEKHEGYGPVHMLQGCWKGGGGLAGYSQQDAHEYLGFILNSLHTANTASEEEEANGSSGGKDSFTSSDDCDCIVHQTFGGLLKSTVTCATCHNTTTAVDPFMDLSLDVRSGAISVKKQKLSKDKLANGASDGSKETAPMDLTECLDRFTSAELLSSDSYYCRKCAASQAATKKLSLARLPPVVPIHLKRFSHSKSLSQSSKVETKIRFPFAVDLTPYSTASSSKSKENGKVANGDGPAKVAAESTAPRIYDLSSVVVHKGKIDNGHYISYARQGDEWFRFDDSMVVEVREKEVLDAEAYLLFYVIRQLDEDE